MVWFRSMFTDDKLTSLEHKILSVLKTTFVTQFIDIDWEKGDKQKIWTISLNTQSKNTPLVLLHGFAAGIGFWVRNLDHLSANRPVYAIDLLGFGKSSRPQFSSDSLEAERQMVDSIEAWRKQMKLDKFILLGHSMGGYLAASYAISYPQHVKHLILADPWGFAKRSQAAKQDTSFKFKIIKSLLYPFTTFNPLATVRVMGPFGPWLISKIRGDIVSKFDDVFEDKSTIPNYIYQCNARNPTGEAAFHNMIDGFAWAKHPMLDRIKKFNKEIAITFIYGASSWMDKVGQNVKELRPDCYIDVKYINDAGHHIYVDQADEFNEIVSETCNSVDLPGGTVVKIKDDNISEHLNAHGDEKKETDLNLL